MFHLRRSQVVFLLSTQIFLLATLPLSATQRKRALKPQPKQAEPAPNPPPPVEPVQLTLQQQPAVAPKVTYQAGQLTIVAENSTLGDILLAVRTQTGAQVEVPANANERVVSHVGPGPAREVLASLLNGSSFNYVILGTASDPHRLDRVVLTPRTGGPSSPVANYQAFNQAAGTANPDPQANHMSEQPVEGEEDSASAEESEDETADNGEEEPAGAPAAPVNAPGQPGNPQGVKTPEQLLQELQRQQQLLQQHQQEPNGTPQQQPPEDRPQD
jgi:hypothetical protein